MNTDDASVLDRMLAANAGAAEIAREIITEARAGLEAFCDIPEGYRHCQLDHTTRNLDDLSEAETRDLMKNPPGPIVNPTRVHLEAIEFFRMILEGDPLVCEKGDALRPTLGAYLVGPPGVGKTHIMAAFGLRIKQQLDKELARMENAVRQLVQKIFSETLDQKVAWTRPAEDGSRWDMTRAVSPDGAPRPGGQEDGPARAKKEEVDMKEVLAPEARFAAAIRTLKKKVQGYPHQPTDMLYLGFEDLFGEMQLDTQRRATAFAAIEQARIVFIDDIHPKGDPERFHVIQQLIERRYELDRPGTFLTTNLTAEELGAGDKTVAQRLLSRCSESFIKFNFNDCTDWRIEVKARRIKLVEKGIRERLVQASTPPAQ